MTRLPTASVVPKPETDAPHTALCSCVSLPALKPTLCVVPTRAAGASILTPGFKYKKAPDHKKYCSQQGKMVRGKHRAKTRTPNWEASGAGSESCSDVQVNLTLQVRWRELRLRPQKVLSHRHSRTAEGSEVGQRSTRPNRTTRSTVSTVIRARWYRAKTRTPNWEASGAGSSV